MTSTASTTLFDRIFGFDIYQTYPFVNFSPLHLWTLLACVALAVLGLLLLFRTKATGQRRFEVVLAVLMVLFQLGQIAWSILWGRFSPATDLIFLHMCGIFTVVGIVLLFTPRRSPFLLNALYFAGLPGALMAISTPDLKYVLPHFMYFMFFLTHTMLAFVPVYFIVLKGFRPEPRFIPKIFLGLNIALVPIYIIDRLTDGNYFYLLRAPKNTLAEVFANAVGWQWYLVPMEFAVLAFLYLFAIPWFRRRKPAGAEATEPIDVGLP